MKMFYHSLAIMLILAMFGCGVSENDQERSRGFEAHNIQNDDNQDSTLIERNHNRQRATSNNNSRMKKANQASDRVAKIDEVDTANVIVTNENAYVAVVLNNKSNNGKLTRNVENKIRNAVRESEKNIQKVYISTNPDFVDRMAGYGDRIQRGEPVKGFMDEFTEMVRRVFPNAR